MIPLWQAREILAAYQVSSVNLRRSHENFAIIGQLVVGDRNLLLRARYFKADRTSGAPAAVNFDIFDPDSCCETQNWIGILYADEREIYCKNSGVGAKYYLRSMTGMEPASAPAMGLYKNDLAAVPGVNVLEAVLMHEQLACLPTILARLHMPAKRYRVFHQYEAGESVYR